MHAPGVALGLAAGGLGARLDVGAQRLADRCLLLGGEQERLVFALDLALDPVQPEVGGFAAAGLGDPAETGVVLVEVAGAAAVASITQALAADPAEQRAGEVVGVLVGAVAGGAVGIEHPLDLIEGLPVDDRLVAPLALDASARDDADVVVVAEHPVDHAARERAARALLVRSVEREILYLLTDPRGQPAAVDARGPGARGGSARHQRLHAPDASLRAAAPHIRRPRLRVAGGRSSDTARRPRRELGRHDALSQA